ncbi:MAG: hypothetical protein PUG47_08050 [Lachnospiraceae bacterium]|nr:hypothetical protein [Lachnospiraceae bacterium]
MTDSRKSIILKNVAPAILANACVFLFSVVDGIFVGNGAGIQALGGGEPCIAFCIDCTGIECFGKYRRCDSYRYSIWKR